MILVTKTSDQTRQRGCMCVCVYVCMCVLCVFYKMPITAIRSCHCSHSMPLALVLPRGNQLFLPRKPLIRREKRDMLSRQFVFNPEAPCAPLFASFLFSRSSWSTSTEPTLSCLLFLLLPSEVVCTCGFIESVRWSWQY